MPITPITVYPQSTDASGDFASHGDIFIKQLATQFVPEANALEENVNAKEISATEQATISTNQADISTAQAIISTEQATISTNQADISTAQAVISSTKAEEAAASAALASTEAGESWAVAAGISASEAAASAALAASYIGTPQFFTKTEDYSLVSTDFVGLFYFNNYGATDEVVFTLPPGVSGYVSKFRVMTNQFVKVVASGTDCFRYRENTSSPGGFLRSKEIGTAFDIEFSNGEWLISNLTNSIKYDE